MTLYTANRACALLYQIVRNNKKGTYFVPANVCPTVPLTIGLAGCNFEFIDIDEKSLCINEETCLSKLANDKDKYVGIIFVRTYGYVYDTSSFFLKLHNYKSDFTIIDDRCLCLPSIEDNLEEADFILYSTGYGKQVNLGNGGYCNSKRNLCIYKSEHLDYTGLNIEDYYKNTIKSGKKIKEIPIGWLSLDDIGISKDLYLEKINNYSNKIVKHKARINSIYNQELRFVKRLPSDYQNWRYNILVSKEQKEEILSNLFDNKCFASSHYSSVNLLFNQEKFKVTSYISDRIINLFNDFYYTEEQAWLTTQIINKILR